MISPPVKLTDLIPVQPRTFKEAAEEAIKALVFRAQCAALFNVAVDAAETTLGYPLYPKEDPDMQPNSPRSMPYPEYVSEVRRTLAAAPEREQKLTLALGLAGEVIEFGEALHKCNRGFIIARLAEVPERGLVTDTVDLLALSAELGDLLWYTVALADVYGIALDKATLVPDTILPPYLFDFHGLLSAVKNATEYVKKNVSHGHAHDPERLTKLLEIVQAHLGHTARFLGLAQNLGQIATMNTFKLRKRYPEGFDTSRSENRPVEAAEPEAYSGPMCPAYVEYPLTPGVCRTCGAPSSAHSPEGK
jgi:NTP pyrophosphatase (non-canonical NTP hydrolase)